MTHPHDPYDVTWDEFRRKTPRVYGELREPGEEPDPATATAYVEQPEPEPNTLTIEGMLKGLSKATSAIASGQVPPGKARLFRFGARVYVGAFFLAFAGGVVGVIHFWF